MLKSEDKLNDVESGLKQQYIESRAYNNNENEVQRSRNQLVEEEESRSSVYICRGLKAVGSLIFLGIAAALTYFMEPTWIWSLGSFFIATVLIIIITGFWRWMYIAAVTAPRDIKALSRFIGLLLYVKKTRQQQHFGC